MEKIKWECPACDHYQADEIDEVDGPFLTCTCEKCGKLFDQDQVVE